MDGPGTLPGGSASFQETHPAFEGSMERAHPQEAGNRSIRSLEDAVKETLTLQMTGGPTAPARARKALGSLERTLADLRYDVDLLVSELVSNSVLHARADHVELHAVSHSGGVHVEVSDPGAGFDRDEARRVPSLTGEGGYGLNIVDAVANRWGVTRDRSARVWFEIDRQPLREADADGRFSERAADQDLRFREIATG
jgi:anti-sigma regulatory factor (Ser/Thr protein kinase)